MCNTIHLKKEYFVWTDSHKRTMKCRFKSMNSVYHSQSRWRAGPMIRKIWKALAQAQHPTEPPTTRQGQQECYITALLRFPNFYEVSNLKPVGSLLAPDPSMLESEGNNPDVGDRRQVTGDFWVWQNPELDTDFIESSVLLPVTVR